MAVVHVSCPRRPFHLATVTRSSDTILYGSNYGVPRSLPMGEGTTMPSDQPNVLLSRRFVEALEYAVDLHREQARKETTKPYVGHLLAVCAIVMEVDGASEDEMIGALLHDSIEDQGDRTNLE